MRLAFRLFSFLLLTGSSIFIYSQETAKPISSAVSSKSRLQPDTPKNPAADFSKPLKKCWYFASNKIEAEKIASDNKDLLITSFLDGKIAAFNVFSGEKIWETDLGGSILSIPFISGENIYIISKRVYEDVNNQITAKTVVKQIIIRSLFKESGLTQWQTISNTDSGKQNDVLLTEPEKWHLTVYDSNLFVINNSEATIRAFDKTAGQLQWEKNYKTTFSTKPFLIGDQLVLGTSRGRILFISMQNGNLINSIEGIAEPTVLAFGNQKGRIISGNRKGLVSSFIINTVRSSLNSSEKRKRTESMTWQVKNGLEISDIEPTSRGFLVSSSDNFLYMLSEENGERIWKKRMTGRIADSPLVFEKYALAATITEPVVSVIDLDNGKTVNKIAIKDADLFISKLLQVQDRLLLTTQRGVYTFSGKDCISTN